MYEVPHLCHPLDDSLSAESRFEKGRSLKILLHVFNLLGTSVTKNKIIDPFSTLEFSGNYRRYSGFGGFEDKYT